MSQQVGPNPIDVRIVEQKDAADAKDHRIEIGYRPSVVLAFNLADTVGDSTMAVSYDGFVDADDDAHGEVKWKGGGAPTQLTPAAGITFEDGGYVIGSDPDISRASKGRLVLVAIGADAPVADLSAANAVEKLDPGGGFGTGRMFVYDATPPRYDWIGPTT